MSFHSLLGIADQNFPPMDLVLIYSVGVLHVTRNVKRSSSSGIDCGTSKVLKSTEVYATVILSQLFAHSLASCIVLVHWKAGNVMPLFKSGYAHSARK